MKEQKKALQNVINICQDGVKGYKKAAEDVENAELKTIFNRLAQQRKLFEEELKNDVRDLGFELEEDGNVKGFFHRTWIDLRSTFTSNETEAVIKEAKEGEEGALEVYNEAISTELPAYIKERLEKQRDFISGCLVQLDEFKEAFAQA